MACLLRTGGESLWRCYTLLGSHTKPNIEHYRLRPPVTSLDCDLSSPFGSTGESEYRRSPFSRDKWNHAQSRHSRKLLDIVGQQRQIMTTSRGRNDQIVSADHLTLLRQFGMDLGMN